MSSSKLIRWGGVAAILTGLLGILGEMALLLYGEPPAQATPVTFVYEIAWGGSAALSLITALAIRQIHLQYGRGFGRLGKIAVFLVLLSGVLFSVKTLIVLVTLVIGARIPYVIMPLFMLPGSAGALVGPVLLGIAILRAGVMPTWFGWLQTLSVPISLAANLQHYGGFAGGCIAIILGSALLAGWTVRNATPAPSAA